MILIKIIFDLFTKNIFKSVGILVTVAIIGLSVRHFVKFKELKIENKTLSKEVVRQDSVIVSLQNRIIVDSTLHADIIKDLQVVVIDMKTKNNNQAKDIIEKDLLIIDMAKGLKCVKWQFLKNKYKIVDCHKED